MAEEKCILCGHPSRVSWQNLVGIRHCLTGCPVCGEYGYLFGTEREIQEYGDKVAAILRERSLKGYPSITITLKRQGDSSNQMTLDEILALYPRSASEMIDRVLLNLAAKVEHPCDDIILPPGEYPLLFARAKTHLQDIPRMVNLLESLGYIDTSRSTLDAFRLSFTPVGWKKIEELQRTNIDSKQVFVAMWFNSQMEKIFNEGIKPAIEETGYHALPINLKEHNDDICDQIIAEIRRSRFMVADFTRNRGSVYFEAGFALGLGIPVIWTVHKDCLKDLCFDTRQYNHIDYENPADLQERLRNRIRATIV